MHPSLTRFLRPGLLAGLLLAGASQAAEPLSELQLFKGQSLSQGLWRMELVSSDDPRMAAGAAAMGQTGICMDVSKQVGKNSPVEDPRCTPRIVRNTDSQAEVEVNCKDGASSRMLLTRESDKSYLMDTTLNSKDGQQRNFKVRYTHAGACQGDARVQFDKNSPMCQRMDPAKMLGRCARVPESARAQCEQQIKSLAAACQ